MSKVNKINIQEQQKRNGEMTAVIESLESDRGRGRELGQFCRGVCSRESMRPLILGREGRKISFPTGQAIIFVKGDR